MFTFDPNAKEVIGSSISDKGGAFIGVISNAKTSKSTAPGSRAEALQFDLTTDDGIEFKYITIYYTKKDGTPNPIGSSMIGTSLMGILGLKQMQDFSILNGKRIGIGLQKIYFLKNDGSQGFKWEAKRFFEPKSGKTFTELRDKLPATDVQKAIPEWEKNVYEQGTQPYDTKVDLINNTIEKPKVVESEELPEWLKAEEEVPF